MAIAWVLAGPALAQTEMPVIPPPSQRPQQQPAQPQPPQAQPQLPPGARPGSVSMEDLARSGFEVKSMVQAGNTPGRFLVLMQRAGDVRTCLMRIEFGAGAAVPTRQTACF
jgi:hypothetical protein